MTTPSVGAAAPVALPEWLHRLAAAAVDLRADQLSRFLPPAELGAGRPAAVLVLFGETPGGPDLLLIERASSLREHAGQPAFPGGATEAGDRSSVETALREAHEEVGIHPDEVEVFAVLPPVWLPPSGYVVTTVLGWWRRTGPVEPADRTEVAAAVRVPLRDLADPGNRCEVGLSNGWRGPAFRVGGLLVWGFTGGLVDKMLHFGGWSRPWGPGPLLARPAPLSSDPELEELTEP